MDNRNDVRPNMPEFKEGFLKGVKLKRTALHKQYGGNSQGGISNCKDYPLIMLFTSHSGKQHGYQDGWDEQGYFWYTGEGQVGDMEFIRGNKALLNHEKIGKRVFLFENVTKGVRSLGEFQVVDTTYFPCLDRNGALRRGIKFKLLPLIVGDDTRIPTMPKNLNRPNETERRGLVTSRVGQGWYRQRLLERWDFQCAVTGCAIKAILIASHIVPWKDSSTQERLDIDNGILLAPTYDALFDRHLISFADNGGIIVSSLLSIQAQRALGISGCERIGDLSIGNRRYLQRHRERFQYCQEKGYSENDESK